MYGIMGTKEGSVMRVVTSKSKNSESFYITRGYVNSKGVSTSEVYRHLGTLKDLIKEHGPTRDDVMEWAREEARKATKEYKENQEVKSVQITFHADRKLDYNQQRLYQGGYLFLQSIYYGLRLDKTCRKIRDKHSFKFDINAILSDLVYNRVLDPSSKQSAFKSAQTYLEPPKYKQHDIYRALSVLAEEMDLIQSDCYKNSSFVCDRDTRVLYYDCSNFYFETEQESGDRKYGKSKEHRPNPIVQMGLFMDKDGIPLAFSIFPGNQNEQISLKPLETKVLQQFGCDKFIYCSDAGLASTANRRFNHIGNRSFIVTQSIKKLKAEYKDEALDRSGFKRISDGKIFSLDEIDESDYNSLFYKEIPYISGDVDQMLIVTYSPKYAAYQKSLRAAQIERAQSMLDSGKHKKNRKNPNDPARFINKYAVTGDGEVADIHYFLDEEKIMEEERYDGLYAVCTDLLDDDISEILKVSEGRWQIEECFRIMKTDFSARPVYVYREDRIKAHFLICFLALLCYRLLEKKLGNKYTCEEILETLRGMNFADVEEQGFMPLYTRNEITDDLHMVCGFQTDFQFITKQKMKTIQKNSKGR